MSSKTSIGRHRAANVSSNPLSAISKAVGSNAGSFGRQAAVVVVATGLVTSIGLPAQAQAADTGRASAESASDLKIAAPAVSASTSVQIAFDSPTVSSTPAPVKPKPAVAVQSNNTQSVKSQAPAAGANNAAGNAVQAAPAAPAAPAGEVAGNGSGAAVVNAALAQVGMSQDCTALVRNALRAAGLPTTPMGPSLTYKLGTIISAAQAQPGDIAYYSNNGYGGQHIAIYMGNGQAVHGGWLGNQTLVASVNIPTGPPDYYIRVAK